MRQALRCGVILPAALLVLSGCATRGWVKEQMGQQKTEVDQRIGSVETKVGQVDTKVGEDTKRLGTVEARVTEQGQSVQGIGTRMGALETSVGDASDLAKGAGERADGAMARANEVDSRLTRLWNNRDVRNLVETVDVRFGVRPRPTSATPPRPRWSAWRREMKDNPRLAVELEGYTDPSGSLRLQSRAEPATGGGRAPLPGAAGRRPAAHPGGRARPHHRQQAARGPEAPRDR